MGMINQAPKYYIIIINQFTSFSWDKNYSCSYVFTKYITFCVLHSGRSHLLWSHFYTVHTQILYTKKNSPHRWWETIFTQNLKPSRVKYCPLALQNVQSLKVILGAQWSTLLKMRTNLAHRPKLRAKSSTAPALSHCSLSLFSVILFLSCIILI